MTSLAYSGPDTKYGTCKQLFFYEKLNTTEIDQVLDNTFVFLQFTR
jgi:hypothetical protein